MVDNEEGIFTEMTCACPLLGTDARIKAGLTALQNTGPDINL